MSEASGADNDKFRGMFKKAVRQGRSERKGESYGVSHVEPLSDARTKPTGFFSILEGGA